MKSFIVPRMTYNKVPQHSDITEWDPPLPYKKKTSFAVARIATPIDDFKVSLTPFCSWLSKSHEYDNYDKVPYIVLFYY